MARTFHTPDSAWSMTLLWLVTGCLMLQPLSTDLYLASLPNLVGYFSVSVAHVQYTLSVFVMGFGVAQLIVGPLSDRFGRRPVLLVGVSVYFVASIVCALAPSIAWLIAGRLGQAVGACAGVLVGRAVVRDCFDPTEGALFFARASMLVAPAPLLGPILGSYLQVWFGWRSAFIALSLFAVALWWAVNRLLRETNVHKNPDATRPGDLLRNYLSIARHGQFWRYVAPAAFSFMALFIYISGSSFVLIDVLGVPTQYYGFCFAFGVLGYLLGAVQCRKLITKTGIDRTLALGTSITAVSGLLFAALVFCRLHHWSVLVGCQFLTMMAHGINHPCAQSGAVAPFHRNAGAAAGLLGFSVMAGALCVSTILGATHNGTMYPMALTCAGVGVLTFVAARALPPRS